MEKVKVLDCTLRDGGYCNQWKFGYDNAKKIIRGLIESGIDIIECGFLTDRVKYDSNITKYTSLHEAAGVIPGEKAGSMFVCMVNYGEYDPENIPEYDGGSVDGFRIAFHKKDMDDALRMCEEIKKKGYKVFVQAMVSLNYNDTEFLELLHRVNSFEPYAFYIVDSFGVMKQKDLIRLFYLVEHNLKEGIMIGYHAHNNMQLAYSNAQTLVDIHTDREMIIDSSVFGMGRGAGNLNTELFVEYLNNNLDKSYQMQPLLAIIDQVLGKMHERNYWGYSLPNYLSAKYNTHPDYAGYLDAKKTLTVENMDEIFSLMDNDKRFRFDKEYIEDLYTRYLAAEKVQEDHKEELEEKLNGKRILLIAPGRSSADESDKILKEMKTPDVISVSVNFDYQGTDYIFLSNLRRYRELDESAYGRCIVTSNITGDKVYLKTKYRDLLNDEDTVRDNAGLMAIKFLMKFRIKEIMLAGFDGYSHDPEENYADSRMEIVSRNAVFDAMNVGMTEVLKKMSKEVKISFVTKPRHIII